MRKFKICISGFVAGFCIYYFVYQFLPINFYKVSSESMLPTLGVGSYIFIEKYKDVNLDDIVVFTRDEYVQPLVKRVIGISGDTIISDGEYLYINQIKTEYPCATIFNYEIGEDYYFVIGDNFNNSIDSRGWDTLVGKDDIIGVMLKK